MQRRQVLIRSGHSVAIGLICGPAAVLAQPASFPSKPLRLVVPFPPGGTTDIVARVLAEPLGRVLSQAVVVDNRAGAGGTIGMTELLKASADGYTLGLATTSTHGVNPAVYPKLTYSATADFAPVTELVKAPGVLCVHPSVPAQTMPEFLRHLKSNPGRLSYASPGNGTVGHMWGELFKSTTSTFMVHIPYRGAGPALNDVLGGQVQVLFDQVASSLPHLQAGKLRALAVSAPQRLAVLPQVPTYGEHALFANNDPSWFGLVAPARTAEAVIKRIHEAAVQALRSHDVAQRMTQLGLAVTGSSPGEFAGQIRREIDKFQRVARFAKISLD
jgi:tripartite-type tricarboxylate transporter receptor subunit TctC